MTENFYEKLLTFISESERQALCLSLQKSKVQIKGFRTPKDVPPKLLATYIAKNEDSFLHIIKDDFYEEYESKEFAYQSFSPDCAISCLSFLIMHDEANEVLLIDKMGRKDEEPEADNKPNSDLIDVQKKLEAAKTKCQALRKENLKLKKGNNALNDDVNTLNKLLVEKNQRIQELEKEKQAVKDDASVLAASYKKQIEKLNSRIIDLESTNEELTRPPVLVLTKDKLVIAEVNVTSKTYEYIPKINAKYLSKFTEILFVSNEMPFSIKHRLFKIEQAREKAHLFSTRDEMIKYIQRGKV